MKRNIFLSCILIVFFQLPVMADELDSFKQTCKEIGFSPKTQAYGSCVLELRKRKQTKSDSFQAQQPQVNNYPEQQRIDKEAAAERQRNAEFNRQQLELQKQAVEEARKAREDANERARTDRVLNALRDMKQEEADRRQQGIDQMNRVQQQNWNDNQQKINRDWRGY